MGARDLLGMCGDRFQWTTIIHNVHMEVVDEFDDSVERHVAAVLAESVPGVTTVRATSRRDNSQAYGG